MLDIDLINFIENKAARLREILNLGICGDDFQTIDLNGLKNRLDNISDLQLEELDVDTQPYVFKEGNTFKIIVNKNSDSITEDILHELAHIFLHPNSLPAQKYDTDTLREEAADRFTRAFFMPQEVFSKKIIQYSNSDGFIDTWQIANFFKVQEHMVIRRGQDLSIWN